MIDFVESDNTVETTVYQYRTDRGAIAQEFLNTKDAESWLEKRNSQVASKCYPAVKLYKVTKTVVIEPI